QRLSESMTVLELARNGDIEPPIDLSIQGDGQGGLIWALRNGDNYHLKGSDVTLADVIARVDKPYSPGG
ncbi:MAG TPA: hypothetical protein VF995_04300, partial [Actinomycetota bacterium]